MKSVDLGRLFEKRQAVLASELRLARSGADHPSARGEATEDGWAALLRGFLPYRYQVSKGFVIDSEQHRSDEIDLVIHDRQYSPLLLEQGGRIYVPAESVYAVFEVKTVLNAAALRYASAKAASVRRLHRTTVAIPHAGGVYPAREPIHILAGILTGSSGWADPFGRSFVKGLRERAAGEGRIDLGCTLEDGAFAVSDPLAAPSGDGSEPLAIELSRRETSLMSFLLFLLRQLQRSATVAAVDFDRYRALLG